MTCLIVSLAAVMAEASEKCPTGCLPFRPTGAGIDTNERTRS